MATPNLADALGYLELLQNYYIPGINEQIEFEHPLNARIRRAIDGVELKGDQIILACALDTSSGIKGYSTTTAAVLLPTATSNSYDRMTIGLKPKYGRIRIDSIVAKRMQKEVAFGASVLDQEMKGIRKTFGDILASENYGSATGKLAKVASFANGTPDIVTVDAIPGTRFLKEKMVIDFIRAGSDVANAVSVIVTAITSATTFTVTTDGTTPITGTPQDEDIIVLEDSYNTAQQGLEGIIDNDNSFQGITRTAAYWAQANIVNNGDGAGTADVFKPINLKLLANQIKRRSSDKIDFYVAEPDVVSAMRHVLYPERRFNNKEKIELFDTGMDADGIAIMEDADCTPNVIYAINQDSLLRGMLGDWVGIMTPPMGGSGWEILKSTTVTGGELSGYTLTFEHIGELAAKRCNNMGALREVKGLLDGGYGNIGGYAA